MLSGGIDSSLIAAAISSEKRVNVPAIFLAYPGDYQEYSRHLSVATSLGMSSCRVVEADVQTSLVESVYAIERPIAFASSYVAGKYASKIGLSTVLTGDGADELFRGYEGSIATGKLGRIYQQRLDRLHGIPGMVSESLSCITSKLTTDEDYLSKFILGDQLTYGHCELTDKGFMYSSVECRLPFLRDSIVNASLQWEIATSKMPPHLTKPLLRRAIQDCFPTTVSAALLQSRKEAATSIRRNFQRLIDVHIADLSKRGYFVGHPMVRFMDLSMVILVDIFVQLFGMGETRIDQPIDLLDVRNSLFEYYQRCDHLWND